MELVLKIRKLFETFEKILEKETDENEIYSMLSWLSSISGEFNSNQVCEAKEFEYRWLEIKNRLKEIALTNDFEKAQNIIKQNLEQNESLFTEKKYGQLEILIDNASEYFELIAVSKMAI